MIHLDTSALAKLIVRETETATLGRWLRQRDTELIAFCCYDRRLLDAARDTGLPIFALGT